VREYYIEAELTPRMNSTASSINTLGRGGVRCPRKGCRSGVESANISRCIYRDRAKFRRQQRMIPCEDREDIKWKKEKGRKDDDNDNHMKQREAVGSMNHLKARILGLIDSELTAASGQCAPYEPMSVGLEIGAEERQIRGGQLVN
jgi:hypothetical protein